MRLEFPDKESAAQALRDAYDLDGGDEYAAIAKAVNGHEVDVRQSPNIDPRYLYFKNGLFVITDKRSEVNEFFYKHENVTNVLVNGYKYPEKDALAKRAVADNGKIVALLHPDGSTRYLYYNKARLVYVISNDRPAACPAHGNYKCAACSQNPDPGRCQCGYFEETGMHWDTCPGRVRSFPGDRKDGEPILKPNRITHLEPDPNDPNTYRRAAEKFLLDCGLPSVPDAIDQLADAFLPCLRIICERGYHPEGNTWRAGGWRGILTDIRKKSNRLWYRSWIKGGFDDDSARDLINFAGFYVRLGNQGKEWGDWGQPGSAGPSPKYLLGSNTSSESTQWLSPEEWDGINKNPPAIPGSIRKIQDNPKA